MFALLLAYAAEPAAAQDVRQAAFAGSARIGALQREVTIRLICARDRGRVNNLAVELDIPDAEQLQPVFDVIPFEGPDGASAKMRLVVTVPAGQVAADLGSTGSFGNNGAPASTFTFASAVTPATRYRIAYRSVQRLARTLASGPSRLTWRIDNPSRGGPPIEAQADLAAADAARLWPAVSPCL